MSKEHDEEYIKAMIEDAEQTTADCDKQFGGPQYITQSTNNTIHHTSHSSTSTHDYVVQVNGETVYQNHLETSDNY